MALKGTDQLGQKIPAEKAGYMELPGAKKDADCLIVLVEGGVSTKLGCCNFFELEDGEPKQFRCGTCEYLKGRND